MYLCLSELFEIELFICIKMELVLITYSGWCAIKPNHTMCNKHFYLCYYRDIVSRMCIYNFVCFSVNLLLCQLIGPVGSVFTNGPADRSSIPGHVIPKTLKMVLDTILLNTQLYKVRIKGKVEQSRERSSALPYTSV